MRRKTVSGIMLSLLLIGVLTSVFDVSPVASTGFNLVQNPGFEDALAFWYVSMGTATYAADIINPLSGTYCAKGIEFNKGSLGRLYQDMTNLVSPGRQYKISGWIKTQDVIGRVVIALNYVASNGWTPADGYVKEIGYVTGTQDWTYYESDMFTLPSMPSDASAIWFLFDFNNGQGTAWWDDVSLIGPSPHQYTLTIYSSPSGVTFTVDGVSRTTPWSGTYSEGASVSLVMPAIHDGYVWSRWLEDGDTNRIKTVTMNTNITLTGVFTPVPPPPPVGGKATPINIPMNKPETPTIWIWLTTIILSLVLTLVYVKKRNRNYPPNKQSES